MPRPAKRPKQEFDPKRAFGALLRELRRESGLSQEEFAHQMGYHRNYIGQLERGEKSPSLGALFNFASGLGIKPSEMMARIERKVART